MLQNTTTSTGGVGVLGLLGVLFVGLKLGGVIDWSWWWVTAPFWGGFAVLAAVLACMGILWLLLMGLGPIIQKIRRRNLSKRLKKFN